MGLFDPDRGDASPPDYRRDDGVDITPARRSGKLTAAKRLMFWALFVTLGVVVAVLVVSFLFVALRGGALPPTEVFSTIVKVIGNILISLLSD